MGLEPVIGCPDPGRAEEELTASQKKLGHKKEGTVARLNKSCKLRLNDVAY